MAFPSTIACTDTSIDSVCYSSHSLQASDGEGSLLASSAQLPALESSGCGNHVIGGVLDLGSEFERRLAVGGQLACQLRTAVKDKLGKLLHSVSQHSQIITVHAVCLKLTKPRHTTVFAESKKESFFSLFSNHNGSYLKQQLRGYMLINAMSTPTLIVSSSVSTGYTCSAGVACNKLMAKIASAMHKPNQQTVIPPRYWRALHSGAKGILYLKHTRT